MNDEDTLPPEPDIFDLVNEHSDEMPLGLWHMWRFIRAHRSGKQVPETMEYLANAFQRILNEEREIEGTGAKDRAVLVNKHLPITKEGRGRKKQTRRQKKEAMSVAFEIEYLMKTGRDLRENPFNDDNLFERRIGRARKIGKTEAVRRVCKSKGVSETKAKNCHNMYGKHCKYLLNIPKSEMTSDDIVVNDSIQVINKPANKRICPDENKQLSDRPKDDSDSS